MESVARFDKFLDTSEISCFNTPSINTKWCLKMKDDDHSCIDYFYIDKENDKYCSIFILNKIRKKFNLDFKLKSVKIIGQTYASGENYYKEEDGVYTCIIYLTDFACNRQDIINGYTQLDDGNRVLSVAPKYNRLLLFDSNIRYKIRGPSRFTTEILTALCYKLYV